MDESTKKYRQAQLEAVITGQRQAGPYHASIQITAGDGKGKTKCLAISVDELVRIAELLTASEPDDKEKIRRGDLLGGLLGVKYIRKDARYATEWGTKTALGLYLTAKRIIEEGE